jgi:hypothetical protein
MSLLSRLRDWWRPSVEDDHFALDAVCGRMLDDYRTAAARPQVYNDELADILTGLAGCNLAMSRTNRAMGWNPDPTPEEPEHAESVRLAGLLLQEVAYCAAEGGEYRGVRCWELGAEPITEAFRLLAFAYAGETAQSGGVLNRFERWDDNPAAPSVGQALSDLWHAVLPVIHSQAAECLIPLMIAHSYDPYVCDCETCGDPVVVHAGLPAEEQARREQITRGCDQP